MASSYNNTYLNFSTHSRHYSKSQMYFFKILHIISSFPQPSNSNHQQQQQQPESNNVNNNNDDDDNERQQQEQEPEQEKVVEQEKSVDDVASELENEHETEAKTMSVPRGDGNSFDLLVEAARVLSENEKNESESEERIGTELVTRSHYCEEEKPVVVDLNEREPVVRSKRWRNQLLRCRFRDSIVEPLKRTGRNQKKRPLR